MSEELKASCPQLPLEASAQQSSVITAITTLLPLSLLPVSNALPSVLVPGAWTGAREVGSPALCALFPGSSSPPSATRTGSSTLHIAALLEPGTSGGYQRRGCILGVV